MDFFRDCYSFIFCQRFNIVEKRKKNVDRVFVASRSFFSPLTNNTARRNHTHTLFSDLTIY